MNISSLKYHTLLKTVAQVSSQYISKCDPLNSDKDPFPSPKEGYAIDVLMSISNIVSCIDQLHYSIELLSGYRKTLKNMNRYDYIVFGVENYYLRLTSVYDRCLRLTNEIIQLGLPEKECRESTIIKNDYIKNTSLANSLKNLNIFTQPFRSYRNVVAHKSSYSEDKLNKLGVYYLVTEEDNELKKYFHFYKSETDNYIIQKKSEFNENVDKLELLVKVLFDDLYAFLLVKIDGYA